MKDYKLQGIKYVICSNCGMQVSNPVWLSGLAYHPSCATDVAREFQANNEMKFEDDKQLKLFDDEEEI